MTDKIVYLTTRKTTVRRKKENTPKRGVIELFASEGMTLLDACVPADVAARILLVAEKAGVKIR